ncbi:MAG TPA: hypothetical protein VF519_11680 [Mycobacteriales bacterium]|jgi:hypothetical protein
MKRLLLAAALAAAGPVATPASADLCASTFVCAVQGCSGLVNVCGGGQPCTGTVSVCPSTPPSDCTSTVDVCIGRIFDVDCASPLGTVCRLLP